MSISPYNIMLHDIVLYDKYIIFKFHEYHIINENIFLKNVNYVTCMNVNIIFHVCSEFIYKKHLKTIIIF